jgi:UrcA family protein
MNITNGNRGNAMQMAWVMLAALCATLLVDTAQAEDRVYSEQRVVRIADLNLNDNAGVETLYQRIQAAANAVCGWPGPVAPEWWRLSKSCTDKATAQAITAIANPALTSRYLAAKGLTEMRPVMAQAR